MMHPHRRCVAVAVTCLFILLGGCTGGDADQGRGPGRAGSDGSGASSSAPPTATSRELTTTTTLGKVAGRLSRDRQLQLKARVEKVVDRWFDKAYVEGTYPRRRFEDAFPGFSAGAKDEARRDAGLMSNAGVGEWVRTVEPRARKVELDVLAVRGRAVGVTARVLLRLDLTGRRLERTDRIAGRLYLTYKDGDWQVFGYDVTRTEV